MTTHHREGYLIHTHYDPKPIPIRGYDWCAVLDGYDGGDWETPADHSGYGRTEEGAIQELLLLIRSEDDEYLNLCRCGKPEAKCDC